MICLDMIFTENTHVKSKTMGQLDMMLVYRIADYFLNLILIERAYLDCVIRLKNLNLEKK